jgi:hypothetical protein
MYTEFIMVQSWTEVTDLNTSRDQLGSRESNSWYSSWWYNGASPC